MIYQVGCLFILRSNVYSHSDGADITSVALNYSSILYVRQSVETGSPFCALKIKVKGRVWGFFGTAACRPIVPLPPMSSPHSSPEALRTT